ncbi:MAG: hypothetical protein IJK17_01660 [Lachnospiraceae bacterium]|nr:hypothetical protein [Lachnospiraceae bacterium]
MKKSLKLISGSLLALMLVLMLFPMRANAASKTYTVAIRSGQSGSFNESAVKAAFPDAEVDAGYIKFTVARGETITDAFASNEELDEFLANQNNLKTATVEGGTYRVLPVEDFDVTKGVTRNTDVVLSYCRVVNPARYVIEYVNGDNGADLAAPTFGLEEAGTEIDAKPLAIAGFHTSGEATKLVLEEGKTLVVRFLYSQNESTVYNTEITYTEGDTVYNDIINRIGQVFNAGAGAGADAGAGEDLVAVDEAETPLANNTLEDNGLVELEENETPLSNQVLGNTKLFAIIAGFAVLLAVGVAATLKIKKNAK